jgi:probable phosphoglycerate mutase
MILYVTRHGETDYNVQKRYTGSTDIPLNTTGIRQAENLSNKLSDIKFDIIISSPLLRAKQTAEIINKSFNTPIVIMDEFSEINAGVYEGLTRAEAQMKYPEVWARLADFFRKSNSRPLDDAPTGGETVMQFDTRITAGLNKLKAEYAESRVLLVCHGFTARAVNRQLMELSFKDMDAFVLGNCEIAEYKI